MHQGLSLQLEGYPADGWLFICGHEIESGTADQLRGWAAVEDGVEPSRGALTDAALTFDGLVAAAITGVIGNAAFSIFPLAAHWLRMRKLAEVEATQEKILDEVKRCLERLNPGLTPSLIFDLVEHREDGSWLINVRGGRPEQRYNIIVSKSGDVIRVRRRSS